MSKSSQKHAQYAFSSKFKQQKCHKIWKKSNLQKTSKFQSKQSNPQVLKKTQLHKKKPKFAGKPQGWQHCCQSNNCRTATHALQYCLWRIKQNSFHNVITMDDLIKNYSNRMHQGGQTAAREPHTALWDFRKIVFLFLHIAKCRNFVKWYCGQWRIYA